MSFGADDLAISLVRRLRLGIVGAGHNRRHGEELQAPRIAPEPFRASADIVDDLARQIRAMNGNEDAFRVAGGEFPTHTGNAGLEKHRRALR